MASCEFNHWGGGGGGGGAPRFGNDHPNNLRLGHYSARLGHYSAGQAKRTSQGVGLFSSSFF